MGSVGQWHHPDPETPAAAEGIILEALLWCQLKVFECQAEVPDVPDPGVTKTLCAQLAELPAQVSLDPFGFIPQPWWLRTVAMTLSLIHRC